jgi:hypothetical protein
MASHMCMTYSRCFEEIISLPISAVVWRPPEEIFWISLCNSVYPQTALTFPAGRSMAGLDSQSVNLECHCSLITCPCKLNHCMSLLALITYITKAISFRRSNLARLVYDNRLYNRILSYGMWRRVACHIPENIKPSGSIKCWEFL